MKRKSNLTTEERIENMAEKLAENQRNAINMLGRAHAAMAELAEIRAANKLSNNRIAGVARELKELMKVMSVYEN